MLARKFGVDMHVVTTDVSVARNLMLAVERCHLNVEAMVASPYVAGLSVLADDEGDLGAAVIDMGAGTTTIAVFSGGRFIHADGFALGGTHVTMDIARGLNARIADAERIKTLYGSVLAGGSDERDMISVPSVDARRREAPQFVSRAQSGAHHQAAHRGNSGDGARPLAASPFAAEPRGRVILTGGASQLTGLPDLAGADPQPAGAHRPAARHRRAAGGGQGTGIRRRDGPAGLSAGGASRAFRTAANAALDDRNGQLYRTGRTMASGELLMTHRNYPSAGGGPARPAASHDCDAAQ